MNNFELLDKWCETCLDYINPLLWKEIQSRGLVNIVNYLPSNIEEAKVEVGRRKFFKKLRPCPTRRIPNHRGISNHLSNT